MSEFKEEIWKHLKNNQAKHQVRSHNFCGAAEEGLPQSREIFADELGGYGR